MDSAILDSGFTDSGFTDSAFTDSAFMDSAMASVPVTTILQFVLTMTWKCLNDTPNSQKNVYFIKFMPSEAALEEIVSLTSITFASGLLDVLQAASPPTLDYFKTLSTETLACWGVYILIMEKCHCRPRIYIGSGTNSRDGLKARFRDYKTDGGRELPRYVEKSFEEGYKIVHKAPLCCIPKPSASLEPKLRLLSLALEATFAYMLWAMKTVSRDYGMAHICLWDRSDLEWDGLCSHCSLFEGIPGDFGLTAEEIEALSAEKMFARLLKANETAHAWYHDQMENNHDEFRKKQNKSRAALVARSHERFRKANKEFTQGRYEARHFTASRAKLLLQVEMQWSFTTPPQPISARQMR